MVEVCFNGKWLGRSQDPITSLMIHSMFTSSLNEEVKSLEEDIEAVKDKVDDPVICEKVRQFVYAPNEIQAIYKSDSGTVLSTKREHIEVNSFIHPS